MKILATLLVCNEADMIADCLDHHLQNGIDAFFVTDHASTDGTWEVLESYSEVILDLRRESQLGYWQSEWVTRMAQQAAEHNPDWIVHLDADERWTGFGSLRSVSPDVPCVRTGPWRNHLPLATCTSPFHRPQMPYYEIAGKTEPHESRFVAAGSGVGGKVIHRPLQDVIVGVGNHWLHAPNVLHRQWDAVVVHHYPVRSLAQFQRKVIQGGNSVDAADLAPGVSAHWRTWHAAEKANQLENVYRSFLLSDAEIETRLRDGTLFLSRDQYL